tara:strand:- start:1107 stop:1505 length:399 start_codon:yes stop_codon:yes gene_type:complete
MKIYSGIFFDNGLHMTWDYNPGKCKLPHNISDDVAGNVIITGGLFNHAIGYLTCERVGRSEIQRECNPTDYQPHGGIPLHITLYTAPNISPVQSGLMLKYMTQEQRNVLLFSKPEQYIWSGKWGYFEEEKDE